MKRIGSFSGAAAMVFAALLSAACSSAPRASEPPVPAHFVEAGRVTPHRLRSVERALSREGIEHRADHMAYPLPYPILVAPEKRHRAAEIIAEARARQMDFGY